MQSKALWIVGLVLLVSTAVLFSSTRKKEQELVALRAASAQMQALEAELDELKTGNAVQAEEVARLQKNTEELLGLRNEVYQLRKDKEQLTKRVQAVQANQVIGQQQVQQMQQLQAENETLRLARTQADEQGARNRCINNLRQIDAAKQQWALENKKRDNDIPTPQEIAVYIKDSQFPACVGGGTYTINAVNTDPVCSIPGHVLPTP